MLLRLPHKSPCLGCVAQCKNSLAGRPVLKTANVVTWKGFSIRCSEVIEFVLAFYSSSSVLDLSFCPSLSVAKMSRNIARSLPFSQVTVFSKPKVSETDVAVRRWIAALSTTKYYGTSFDRKTSAEPFAYNHHWPAIKTVIFSDHSGTMWYPLLIIVPLLIDVLESSPELSEK